MLNPRLVVSYRSINADPTPLVPNTPLHRTAHNPHARATHSYSIVDDLAQSPVSTWGPPNLPFPAEGFTISLGHHRPIKFEFHSLWPRKSLAKACLLHFKSLSRFKNLIIHWCIIDEGASTCVMSTMVWHKLGSLESHPPLPLKPMMVVLLSLKGFFRMCPLS